MDFNDIAEVELHYTRQSSRNDRIKVTTSRRAFEILLSQWDLNKIELLEQCKIMLLDRALGLLGISTLSTGGVAGTVVDPKIIFALALKANASGIIIAHNHPSGNLEAGTADIKITEQLKQAGKLLEIEVADHLIISKDGFYTFSEDNTYERTVTENGFAYSLLPPF